MLVLQGAIVLTEGDAGRGCVPRACHEEVRTWGALRPSEGARTCCNESIQQ